ncbi:MAG: leucine-rich repeat domain-containing protein, partial [bacterium]
AIAKSYALKSGYWERKQDRLLTDKNLLGNVQWTISLQELIGNESCKSYLEKQIQIKQELDLSALHLDSIVGIETLNHVNQVKKLNLSANFLTGIDEKAFETMSELEEITLTGNELKTLPKLIFDKNKKLTKICIRKNKLESLPDGIFDNLPELKVLNLSSNKEFKKLPYFGGLRLSSLSLANSNINEAAVRTTGIFTKSNETTESKNLRTYLKELNLGKNEFTLESGELIQVLREFRELQILNLSENNISNFNKIIDCFIDTTNRSHEPTLYLTRVEHLFLAGNKFTKLSRQDDPKKTKEEICENKAAMKSVKTLDLSNCKELEELKEGDFDHMPNLETLIIEHALPDYKHVAGWMEGNGTKPDHKTSYYQATNYKKCGLKKLDKALNKLKNLTSLYLRNNRLEELNSDNFRNLKNLEILDVSGNKLSVIKKHAFLDLGNLTHLDVACSSGPVFSSHKELGKYADGDSLKIENEAFCGLCSLQYLDLSYNTLEDVPAQAFVGLCNVKGLNLSNNRIHGLPHLIFSGLHNLECIDVSGNKIQAFEKKVSFGLDKKCVIKLMSNPLGAQLNFLGSNMTPEEARGLKYLIASSLLLAGANKYLARPYFLKALTGFLKIKTYKYFLLYAAFVGLMNYWRKPPMVSFDAKWYNKVPVVSSIVRGMNWMSEKAGNCWRLVSQGEWVSPAYERILLKEDAKSLYITDRDAAFYAKKQYGSFDQYLAEFKARRAEYIKTGIPQPKVIQREISWTLAGTLFK